jgi:hypothetical protein
MRTANDILGKLYAGTNPTKWPNFTAWPYPGTGLDDR